jgi:hypothetical protein
MKDRFSEPPEVFTRYAPPAGRAALIIASIFVGLILIGLILSLFYNPPPTPSDQARRVAEQYFQAHKVGDGKTYCALLSVHARELEERAYDGARRDITCSEAHSDHSPALTRAEQQETRQLRNKVYKTLKITGVSVRGTQATVRFSFINPSPVAAGGIASRYEGLIDPDAAPAAGQGELAQDTLSLTREGSSWKIALSE